MPPTNLDDLRLSSGYLQANATQFRMGLPNIATTGVSEQGITIPYAGVLAAAVFVAKDALAQDATNIITFTITNRTSGAGTTVMLAATDANTTKTSTGSAIGVWVKRTLALNATPANLVVAAGDTLHIACTVTGTLANAVTACSLTLTITPT